MGGQERWILASGAEHLEDLGTEERIILKWILNRMGERGLDFPNSHRDK
jgi:hypothetical protein